MEVEGWRNRGHLKHGYDSWWIIAVMLDALSGSSIFPLWIIKERNFVHSAVYLFFSAISKLENVLLEHSASTISGNYTRTSIYRLWALCWPNNQWIRTKRTAKLMKTFKFVWKIQKRRIKKPFERECERKHSSGYQRSICSLLLIGMTFYCWDSLLSFKRTIAYTHTHTHGNPHPYTV